MTLIRSAAGLALALLLPAAALAQQPAPPAPSAPIAGEAETRQPQRLGRAIALVRRQAERLGVPPDLAQAVMMAESEGDPTRTGPTGETGLMGLRLATAMMLGFRGDQADLFDPALNAGYGVAHLAQAWRIAAGDPCKTYVKYRTHYGEERVTGRFAQACARLRTTLAALNSPLAAQVAGAVRTEDAETAEGKPAETKGAEPKVADAKPADAKVPDTKAADAKPATVPAAPQVAAAPEPKAEAAPAPPVLAAVAHPAPPARPKTLAAARAEPAPRRGKAAARAAKAAPRKAEAVTLVAKTRQGSRSTLTCKGRACTQSRSAARR